MRVANVILVAALGCSHHDAERRQLATTGGLCVTMGALSGKHVDAPTFRAVAPGFGGDAATLQFRVDGTSSTTRALASGQMRRQLGLKLRAADGCNLVYAMWRIDPKPQLDISVKRNAGARSAKQCGNRGYTRVGSVAVPTFDDRHEHELRGQLDGDDLRVWLDGALAWQGAVPATGLAGPAGIRSDNVAYEILDFSADPSGAVETEVKCRAEDDGD